MMVWLKQYFPPSDYCVEMLHTILLGAYKYLLKMPASLQCKARDLKCGDVRQTEMVDTWGVVQGMGNDIDAALLTLGLPAFGVILKKRACVCPWSTRCHRI